MTINQSLPDEVFPSEAWEEAKVVDGNDQEQTAHYRIDVLWWYISQMNVPESDERDESFQRTV